MRPGSSLGRRVDAGALQARQCPRGAQRQRRIQQQGHQRGQDRVAPEQGHEPRRARDDQRFVGVVGVEEAQRAQVLTGAAEGSQQPRDVGVEGRQPPRPRGLTLRGHGRRGRLAAGVARRHDLAAAHGQQLHARRPLRPGVELGVPGHDAVVAAAGALLRADDQAARVRGVGDAQAVCGGRAGRGRGFGSAFLHREEVGEIGVHLQAHRHRAMGGGEVAHAHVQAGAPTDPEVALHQQGAVRGAAGEGGGERRVRGGGERFEAAIRDRQHQARADPRVADEDALDASGHVAARVADREARALDERDGPGGDGLALLGERPGLHPTTARSGDSQGPVGAHDLLVDARGARPPCAPSRSGPRRRCGRHGGRSGPPRAGLR